MYDLEYGPSHFLRAVRSLRLMICVVASSPMWYEIVPSRNRLRGTISLDRCEFTKVLSRSTRNPNAAKIIVRDQTA